jgi:hypothetical protein
VFRVKMFTRMIYGLGDCDLWFMVYGLWFMVYGSWFVMKCL